MKIIKKLSVVSVIALAGLYSFSQINATEQLAANKSAKAASVNSSSKAQLNSVPNVIPAIHHWQGSTGYFELAEHSQVILSGVEPSLAQTFVDDLFLIAGARLPKLAISSTASQGSNNIHLKLVKAASLGDEGYRINIGDNVIVEANTAAGIFYATQTLQQIFIQDGSALNRLAKGKIEDQPTINERAFMLDIGRKYFEMDYLKKTIRQLAWQKMNTFHMHFTDWSGFRLQSDKFPGLASEQSYSKAQISELQDYAKKYHVMIIPEIDLPAHASHIVGYQPDLAFQCESMRTGRWVTQEMLNKIRGNDDKTIAEAGWVLDITKPHVRTFIKELLDEFVPLFDSPYFHVGGDEWQFDNQKTACPELMAYTKEQGYKHPGDPFVAWINQVNQQVKSYGKTTRIWNWWRYQNIAKNELAQTSIQPDKDIVVTVWNKSREQAILDDGYQVNISTEEGPGGVYSTPGEKGRKPGDYGYFDQKGNYENFAPVKASQINGYTYALWTDKAEHMPEKWFDMHVDKPRAVFAEKMWGKQGSATLKQFHQRLDKIADAPLLLK